MTMRPRGLLIGVFPLLAGTFLLGAAEPGVAELKLRGIVSFSTNQFALLEDTTLPSWRGEMMLCKGQREGDTEVLEISAGAGKVRISKAGKPVELGFGADLPAAAWVKSLSGGQRAPSEPTACFLLLQQAGPSQVFRIYQLLAERSLIRPSMLPAFRLDLGCKDAAGAADLAKAIEQALAAQGILLRSDGEKFVLAGRESDFGRITPQMKELAAMLGRSRSQAGRGPGEQVLAPGMINFPGTDLNQVLMIYQELADRTLLRPTPLPSPIVSFQNHTPLTLAEAIYAFQAMLAMNGISAEAVGDRFLFVFPISQKAKLDSLLARKPSVRSLAKDEGHAAGTISLSYVGLAQLAALYGELCAQQVEVGDDLPQVRFDLRSQTSLTSEEALQGLDLLLGWNDLAVAPREEGKGFKVVRLPWPR